MGEELAMSRADLPALVARGLGDRLEDAARLGRDEPRSFGAHFGAGMAVRNLVRRYSAGWTDADLDNGWPAVAQAAWATARRG